MALLKYFKQVDAKKPIKIDIVLPKPDGPLSSVMPSLSIESANVAVKKAMLTLHVSLWKVHNYTCSMLDYRNSIQIIKVTNFALTMKLLTMYTVPNIFINMMSMYN